MSDSILLERDGQIGTIVLNRPAQRNAINLEMWERLGEIASELDRDDGVRVVIVRGAGDTAFSAGADISEFDDRRSDSAQARAYGQVMDGATDLLAGIGKPTISMIHGFCVGGGLELATATDLRLAAGDARFGVPIARLGILVGYTELKRLVHLVGAAPTMDLLLTARLIDSDAALRIGLVNEVLPPSELEAHTYDLARKMCELAPLSARWHKEILAVVQQQPHLERLGSTETALPYLCFDTDDFKEGRRAFLEKRKPQFKGR